LLLLINPAFAGRYRKACRGLPQDFLSRLLALPSLMRLALRKAAHAAGAV